MCVLYRPCEFQLILNHQCSKLLKPLVAQRGKELQDLVTESNFVAQTHPENRIFVFAMKWLQVHKENSLWRPGDQVKPVQGHQMKFSSIPPSSSMVNILLLGSLYVFTLRKLCNSILLDAYSGKGILREAAGVITPQGERLEVRYWPMYNGNWRLNVVITALTLAWGPRASTTARQRGVCRGSPAAPCGFHRQGYCWVGAPGLKAAWAAPKGELCSQASCPHGPAS